MNRCFSHEQVRLFLPLLFILSISWATAAANTFVAVASGSWNSALTWGGVAPPHEITSADQIIINAGITVSLDGDVTLNHQLAVMTVFGQIDGAAYDMEVTAGVVGGTGSITVNNLLIQADGSFIFTGNVACSSFTNHNSLLNLKAELEVASMLKLMDGLCEVDTSGLITLDSNATVLVDNGSLGLNGGNISVLGTYNLIYVGTSTSTGVEAELGDVGMLTLLLADSAQTLTLTQDLIIHDSTKLIVGSLKLNEMEVTFGNSLDINLLGYLEGDTISKLKFVGNASSILKFDEDAAFLGNLTLTDNDSCIVTLASGLVIHDSIQVQSGTIVLNGNELTLNGAVDFGGQGSLSGDANAAVLLNGTGNVSLQFTPGSEQLGDCVVNLDSGVLTLNSDLAIENNLQVQSGTVVLNGNELTLNGAVDFGGQGSLSGDANAAVSLNGSGNVSLQFAPGSEQLGDCVVNLGSGELTLNSDLHVYQKLDLMSGFVILQNEHLIMEDGSFINGGSADAYVISQGEGRLILDLHPNDEAFFPVGTLTDYAPCMIKQGQTGSQTQLGVAVIQGVYADGTTGIDLSASESLIRNSWLVEEFSANASLDLSLTMFWDSSAAVNGFNPDKCYISHYTNGEWDTYTAAAATLYSDGTFSITRETVQSLSPFRVISEEPLATGSSLRPQPAIYPNPVASTLSLRMEQTSTPISAAIYDNSGRLVIMETIPIGSSFHQINTDMLEGGIYWLVLNGYMPVKFVKVD